ncbi:MAG: ornithine cyclodeaminase family protein [Galactobacter sp.]|uniref:ornithine cyclodeaminase family protein n=1 Tax=Galactobacter sp. TaxID=2676125 RepID=UPI0025C4695B|nr:hypothetical protein [Galactobacter sp.]
MTPTALDRAALTYVTESQVEAAADWGGIVEALREGHRGPRPKEGALFVGDDANGMYSRSVLLPGRGGGAKISSIFPANTTREVPLPTEHSLFIVFDEDTKAPTAILESAALTVYKTAADSALAAGILSREDSNTLLVLGAGPVARALPYAYLAERPGLERVLLWNRTPSKLQSSAEELRTKGLEVEVVKDLDAAVEEADIVAAATRSQDPLIRRRCVRPGTHVDLIGSFREDMREADAALVSSARLFVDNNVSAWESGDLDAPRRSGLVDEDSIEADLFDLVRDRFRRDREDVTVFKNAGGAHLDLMVARYVLVRLPD